MGRSRRVLIVDYDQHWRETLMDVFLKENMYVQAVSSVEQALNKLNEDFFHLIILDIQMVKDEKGIKETFYFLENLISIGINNVIKVIILTEHANNDTMKIAFREYQVADFLFKKEYDTSTFIEDVQRVFIKEPQNNFVLKIDWQGYSGSEQIVRNHLWNDSSLNLRPALLHKVAAELEDLLCQLFFQAERITVRPLLDSPNMTSSLLVEPLYSTEFNNNIMSFKGHNVVIKLGSVKKIEEEYRYFKEYVETFIDRGRNISVLNVARTPLLGGIMYSLARGNNDQWEDFGKFFLNADIRQIEEILHEIFFHTCRTWYANSGSLQTHNLTKDYQQLFGFTFEDLGFLVSNHLKSVQAKNFLYFSSLTTQRRLFTNPLKVCATRSFIFSTYVCITHGNLNQHNILVENNKQVWLVDFQHTSPGHILRDVSQLDTTIRFHLLRAEDATLDERLAMEEALCSVDRFSQVEQLVDTFSTENKVILKVYNTVVCLRRLARMLIMSNPADDMSEYYVALLYNSLHTLGISALSVVQREHALLCASILAERLGLGIRNAFTDDVLEVQTAISNRSYESYQKLAAIILKRMGAFSSTIIPSTYFSTGTLREIVLPEIGLYLANQKALFLLRQKEVQDTGYRELQQLAGDNALIMIVDIANVVHSPFQDSPRTIHFSVDALLEIIDLSQNDLPGWLGRFIVTRAEKNVKQVLLPYETEGAAKLFVGRKYELTRMTRLDRLGGIITGAHQSGKSSLLQQLGKNLRQNGIHVIGPLMLGGIGFQTFFERTLQDFGIVPSHDMTPEIWAAALRRQGNRDAGPVFLLDEVDDLLALDAQHDFILGKQIRSLHHEGYCQFYLAGLEKLRGAMHQQYGPFRNFASKFTLTGVTEEESKQLIQRPMNTIGFHISDEQVTRIFKGTAGVPYLIQDFCIRLLCSISHEQANKTKIEDSAIAKIEMSPEYHTDVIRYYDYAQEWDSRCIMLCAILHKEINRQKIIQEFTKNDAPLERLRLDTLLEFLVSFGILQESPTTNLYSILPEYLARAYMAREPVTLLHALFKNR